jgi:hypothetical protein
MYIAAALCAWFLRAWKIREMERLADEKRVAEAALNGGNGKGSDLKRHASRVSTIKKARGLWAWERV